MLDYGILNHIVINSVHSVWYTQIMFSLASFCHKAGTYKPMDVKPAVNLDGTMRVWIIHSFLSCLEVLLLLSPHGSAVSWLAGGPDSQSKYFKLHSINAFLLCSLVVLSLDKPSEVFSVLILLVVWACQSISL